MAHRLACMLPFPTSKGRKILKTNPPPFASPRAVNQLPDAAKVLVGMLPQGAIVANIGRGTAVVDEDLVNALASGRIAAGLDVFNNEPEIFPAYAALLNVFMLPHIGSSTMDARQAMGAIVVQGLTAFREGQPTPNRIA